MDWPRSDEDKFYLAIYCLASKSFVPRSLIRRLLDEREHWKQNVEPVFAMYVDDAHNDVPVPAAHAWDDTRHAYPQPHTESGVAHCPPFGQRTPKLFFRAG